MARAQAFVFDAYGTLFDVMGVEAYGFQVTLPHPRRSPARGD
jgi:FMN phosphatase YigB (HAD superfamily)